MKVNKTYRQFIKESEYSDEDKEILMEIFEAGNSIIEIAEKVNMRLINQESLQARYNASLRSK